MIVEIGQFAAFCGLLAAVLTLIDWMMPDDKRLQLGEELIRRMGCQPASYAFVAKTPILVLDRILSASLLEGRRSWKRTASVSGLLLAICLVSAGLVTDTVFGFEDNPHDAYRKEIKLLEMSITEELDLEVKTEEAEEMELYRQDMNRILETAKHPFARWTALVGVALLVTISSILFTNFALYFTAVTTKAIVTTDQSMLIAGAILLNGCVSLLIFLFELVALSIISSFFILFLFSLFGLLFGLGPTWAPAAIFGYSIFAWYTAPIWLKALATASLVPFLLMVVAIGMTAILYPIRKPIFSLVMIILRGAATHREGPVAFFATAFFCLAAAVTAATNFVN